MRGKDKSPKKNRSTPQIEKAKRKKSKVLVNYISYNVRGVLTLNQLKELNYYQRSTGFLIPKMSFSKLVREIFQMFKSDFRIRMDALEALQTVAELYLTELFSDANRCAGHARRVTIKPPDIRLVLDLRGVSDPGYQKI